MHRMLWMFFAAMVLFCSTPAIAQEKPAPLFTDDEIRNLLPKGTPEVNISEKSQIEQCEMNIGTMKLSRIPGAASLDPKLCKDPNYRQAIRSGRVPVTAKKPKTQEQIDAEKDRAEKDRIARELKGREDAEKAQREADEARRKADEAKRRAEEERRRAEEEAAAARRKLGPLANQYGVGVHGLAGNLFLGVAATPYWQPIEKFKLQMSIGVVGVRSSDLEDSAGIVIGDDPELREVSGGTVGRLYTSVIPSYVLRRGGWDIPVGPAYVRIFRVAPHAVTGEIVGGSVGAQKGRFGVNLIIGHQMVDEKQVRGFKGEPLVQSGATGMVQFGVGSIVGR